MIARSQSTKQLDENMDSVFDTLRKANEQYPESKIVWIAVAIAAASAIIASLKLGWGALLAGSGYVLGTIVMFSFVLLIYNTFSSLGESVPGAKWLAALVAWSSTAIIILTVLTFLSCLFLGKPRTFRELIYDTNPIIESSEQTNIADPVIDTASNVEAGARESVVPQTPVGLDAGPTRGEATKTAAPSIEECLESIDSESLSLREYERVARECRN